MKIRGASMSLDEAAFTGAKQIILHGLGLTLGQELLIFVDETTVEVGRIIVEAAYHLGVSQAIILIPIALQRRIPKETNLSLLVQGAAKDARAILTCVNGTPECLPFRERILETHWSARTRIGHMPGANLDVLRLANVDFEQLIADCHRIELAMARGRTLQIISYASDGTPHHLTADIGGWERLPVASDGVIGNGVWGNTPSGETYIAPIEGSAEGSIVINGSIPHLVIDPGKEITLFFERGRLVHVAPPDSPTAKWLNETQIQVAQAKGDHNWSNLGEIGIGTNPAVEHLTGNMIFDEKAAGTAHIALGSNVFMGGAVDAAIHCDMVVWSPTVIVDNKMILNRGNQHFVVSEWRENYTEVSLKESPVRTAVIVARTGIQVIESNDDRLQRTLRSEPGRVSACFVGDDETAKLAKILYTLISAEGDWLPIEELASRAKLESETVQRVLHVIWSYDLVRFR